MANGVGLRNGYVFKVPSSQPGGTTRPGRYGRSAAAAFHCSAGHIFRQPTTARTGNRKGIPRGHRALPVPPAQSFSGTGTDSPKGPFLPGSTRMKKAKARKKKATQAEGQQKPGDTFRRSSAAPSPSRASLAARGAEDFRTLRAHRPRTRCRPCRASTLSGSSNPIKSLAPKQNLLEARRERYRNEKMSSRLFPWQVLPSRAG
jgi:hypothetical protein